MSINLASSEILAGKRRPFGQRFDRDAFHSLRSKRAALTTTRLFSAVQHLTPEEQIAGLACAFLLLSEHYRMPAQDAFTATKAMMHHHEAHGGTAFDGLRSYLGADVFKRRPNSTNEIVEEIVLS